jgi:hypothetical protein
MNNEPVAWMTAQGIQDVCTVNEKEEMGNDFDDYIIPLYTHPSEHDLGVAEAIGFDKGYKAATAKTLTDEEIIEIGNAVTNLIDSNEGWIEFARAILKKASEK